MILLPWVYKDAADHLASKDSLGRGCCGAIRAAVSKAFEGCHPEFSERVQKLHINAMEKIFKARGYNYRNECGVEGYWWPHDFEHKQTRIACLRAMAEIARVHNNKPWWRRWYL